VIGTQTRGFSLVCRLAGGEGGPYPFFCTTVCHVTLEEKSVAATQCGGGSCLTYGATTDSGTAWVCFFKNFLRNNFLDLSGKAAEDLDVMPSFAAVWLQISFESVLVICVFALANYRDCFARTMRRTVAGNQLPPLRVLKPSAFKTFADCS
jgi:hypothetical protein